MVKDDKCTQELRAAIEAFASLLDPEHINSQQEYSPATVYTPYVTSFLMVYQRLTKNASLEEAVAELRDNLHLAPFTKRVAESKLSANSGAYSRSRKRLDLRLAEGILESVYHTLTEATPPVWEDRRVFIFDGTTFSLRSDKRLREIYPPASNQHGQSIWPVMHCAVAHELASGCAMRPEIGAMYGPQAVSELTLATRMLSRLPVQSVVMADCNFGIFAFVHAVHTAGHQVLARLTPVRANSLICRATPMGADHWTLVWKPTAADRRKNPALPADASLPVTIYQWEGTDSKGKPQTLWWVTTLEASREQISALYYHRQQVETDIRDVKVALQMDELSGRSDPMLQKELALGMVAYNLVIQVRRLAAKQAGVRPRQLSFKGTWSLVTRILLRPKDQSLDEYIRQFEWTLQGCQQRALPKRPGRKYPREVLRRGPKYPQRSQKPKEATSEPTTTKPK